MANRVVIVDAHRAKERIPYHELKQMMGRVSRGNDKVPGKVDFILGTSCYEEVVTDIKANEKYQVKSALANDIEELAFHVMAEISRGAISKIEDIDKWHARSLHKAQHSAIDSEKIVKHLKSCDCVIQIGSILKSTILGHASARYYFTPSRLYSLTKSFEEIFAIQETPDTIAISWALASEGKSGAFDPKEVGPLIGEFKCQLNYLGLEPTGRIKGGLAWWYLLGGPPTLKMEAWERRKEWPRLYRALRLINKFKKWPYADFLSDLDVRICNRAEPELVPLCRAGFPKTIALELYNMNIKTYEDVKERLQELLAYDNPLFVEKVRQVVHGHNKQLRSTRSQCMFRVDEK